MKYYIIAGEASGDLHGSNLMKGIYAEDPQADVRFWGGDLMLGVYNDFQNNPSQASLGPSPCGQGGSTVPTYAATAASSRINVTDNSDLGLPRAVVRMACSKGTYVRAFARDLGEALGSGAHLDSLQRSRSGIFRVEKALTVEQAIRLLSNQPEAQTVNTL